MNVLEIAHKELNNIEMGISFEELKNNSGHHNKLFYDSWGIPWRYDKILYYSDETYECKRKRHWNEANMEGYDLPYKKFLTPEEFETVKPAYFR